MKFFHLLTPRVYRRKRLPKLIIIDDDQELASSLKFALEKNGWQVEVAETGHDGLQIIKNFSFDAVILDWNLPDTTGLQVCKRYRTEGGMAPIIFLTGENDIQHKESGLDMGADDYLTKPFDVRELLARLRSLLRRQGQVANPIAFGDLLLDPDLKELSWGEKKIHLSGTEFLLLDLLFRKPRHLFSSRDIFEKAWPSHSEAQEGTVRVHMHALRKKLVDAGFPEIIKTVRGAGYMLDPGDAASG
jgi:DNA-binding response OmpR family regulator